MAIRCMLFLIALLVSGCAQTRYAWNGYDDLLYNYYSSPAEGERFAQGLQETITVAERDGRLPPGIYAEYGYQLFERGRYPEAVVWFAKEREQWPESKFLMDKLIALANNRTAKGSAGGQP